MKAELLTSNTRWRSLVSSLLGVAILFFSGRYVYQHRDIIPLFLNAPNYAAILAAFCLYLVYFGCRVLGWRAVAARFGISLGTQKTFSIWAVSEAARYIPGSVWSLIGRVGLLKREGFSVRIGFSCWVVETVLVLYSSVAVGCFLLLTRVSFFYAALAYLTFLALFFLGRRYAPILVRFLPVKVRSTLPPITLAPFFLYSAGWLCFGLGSGLFAAAFTPLSANTIVFVSGLAIAAWLGGYIVIITPMGLGVREGVFIFLAAALLTPSFASFTAIAMRVWLVMSELFFLALVLVIPVPKRLARLLTKN